MANKELTEEEIRNEMIINIKSVGTLADITLNILNEELTDTSEFQVKSEVKKNPQEEVAEK